MADFQQWNDMSDTQRLEAYAALRARIAELEAERASLLEAAQKAREQAARLELKHGRLSRSEGAGLSGNKGGSRDG